MPKSQFLRVRLYDGRIMHVLPGEIAAIVEHLDVTKRDSQCHIFMKAQYGDTEGRFDIAMPAPAMLEEVEKALSETDLSEGDRLLRMTRAIARS